MRNFIKEVDEALSLNVSQYRNELRAKSFEDLGNSLQLESKSKKFRDFLVLLVKLQETNSDSSIDVIIRGRILSPHGFFRHYSFASFTKHKDNSWTLIKDLDTYDRLRNKLDELIPIVWL